MTKLVLIVDDDDLMRRLLADVLRTNGYATAEAADAAQALVELRRHLPDALLLDMQLKGIAGLQFLKQLKDDTSLRAVPVIALTGHASLQVRDACLAAGCAAFLAKPATPVQLLDAVAAAIAGATG